MTKNFKVGDAVVEDGSPRVFVFVGHQKSHWSNVPISYGYQIYSRSQGRIINGVTRQQISGFRLFSDVLDAEQTALDKDREMIQAILEVAEAKVRNEPK